MLVVADTGVLISLGHVDLISLLSQVFGEFYVPKAVWDELVRYEHPDFDQEKLKEIKPQVVRIKSTNYLSMLMDSGESEAVILYEEMKADFLLIDDQKARIIAESFGINCIGSIGLILKAKEKGLVGEIRPVFLKWIKLKRYFSLKLLNEILQIAGEEPLEV